MSDSNTKYKQVANVTRRTWDTEVYERRAQARAAQQDDEQQVIGGTQGGKSSNNDNNQNKMTNSSSDLPEFEPAPQGAIGPEGSDRAYLKARKQKVDHLDSKVGTVEMVSAAAVASVEKKDGVVKTGIGWYCKVCDCVLKDSHTYLDHINGRKHQRKLGYSMQVERSTKDQVLAKLSEITAKKEKEETKQIDYDELVKLKDDEEAKRKEERKKKRKERKERLARGALEELEGEEEDNVDAEVDPNLAAMMGFSGFGGGK